MEHQFLYLPILAYCDCGKTRKQVRVGITSTLHLSMEWTCEGCKKEVMALMPLSGLLKDAKKLLAKASADALKEASTKLPALLEAPKEEPTEKDLDWLKEAHISWPNESTA